MQFIVCDDVIDPAAADAFERMMLSDQFPWQYYANVNYRVRPSEAPGRETLIQDATRFQESHGFSSVIYPGNEDTHWFATPRRILDSFSEKNGFRIERLLRVKANLLVCSPEPNPKPFTPHVDMPKPHWAMVYYVNDSDGDTVIFDKMYPDPANAAVLHSVSPKKNRAVMFDGRHYHSGTVPARHDVRIVINFDFL